MPFVEQPRGVAAGGIGRGAVGDGARRAGDSRTGATSSPKQLALPVWQVGPRGRAVTSKASRSQSMRMSTRSSKLPLVSPLRHGPPRDRLWKVTSRSRDRRVERGAVHVAEHPHFAARRHAGRWRGSARPSWSSRGCRDRSLAHLDVLVGEIVLEIGDGDAAGRGRRERRARRWPQRETPRRNASGVPAPPEAMTGTSTAATSARKLVEVVAAAARRRGPCS